MHPYTDRTKLLSSYKKADECKLSELVQYQCEVGSTHIECNPFVRLFLKCSNMPMIEVTPEYDQNGDAKMSILPDFGSVNEKKSPPGFAMMENKDYKYQDNSTIEPSQKALPENTISSKQKSNPIEMQMDKDKSNSSNNNIPTMIKGYSNVMEPSRSLDFIPPRTYLDEAVVPTLLEGMKLLASERPSNPLEFLGKFLIERSNSSGPSME